MVPFRISPKDENDEAWQEVYDLIKSMGAGLDIGLYVRGECDDDLPGMRLEDEDVLEV